VKKYSHIEKDIKIFVPCQIVLKRSINLVHLLPLIYLKDIVSGFNSKNNNDSELYIILETH